MPQVQFIATAEHTAGKSQGHPCTRGVWHDVTDSWQETLTAETVEAAEKGAWQRLEAELEMMGDGRCPCAYHRHHGTLDDVCVTLAPQTAEAVASMLADGSDAATILRNSPRLPDAARQALEAAIELNA